MTLPPFRGSLYIDGRWCEADSGRPQHLFRGYFVEPTILPEA